MPNGRVTNDPAFVHIDAVTLPAAMQGLLRTPGAIGNNVSKLPGWPNSGNIGAVDNHVAALNAAQRELLRAALLHALDHGGSVVFKGRQTAEYQLNGGRALEIACGGDGKQPGAPAELFVAFGHN